MEVTVVAGYGETFELIVFMLPREGARSRISRVTSALLNRNMRRESVLKEHYKQMIPSVFSGTDIKCSMPFDSCNI